MATTLSSHSSRRDVLNAYYDSSNYDVARSVTKARTFVTACRMLMLKMPKRVREGGFGGDEVEIDTKLLDKQLIAAQQWIAVNETVADGGSSNVSYVDFRNYRR